LRQEGRQNNFRGNLHAPEGRKIILGLIFASGEPENSFSGNPSDADPALLEV
jgi:hypothetical protein